jgi:hypothetical protein
MKSFHQLPISKSLFKDIRDINIHIIPNAVFASGKTYYPDCIIKNLTSGEVVNPIDEKIMSLQSANLFNSSPLTFSPTSKIESTPVFLFLYNTENYYHFMYDTLPYLISYLELKKDIPNLKLLMNYPNRDSAKIFKFVEEILEILDIPKKDIIIVDNTTLYKKIYISSSYTHGLDSNLPPNVSASKIYDLISSRISFKNNTPNKIYISRRSWVHNDKSNMGTDYTNRRKLTQENELVKYLTSLGFTEVFPEILSTSEKINLFRNAEQIIGPIGGGLVNTLFCSSKCKLYVINSPYFLNINSRFSYSFSKPITQIFDETFHVESTPIKKFMRVQSKKHNIIGEVTQVFPTTVEITYSDFTVAGWSEVNTYKSLILDIEDCIKLDEGLNCEFNFNLENVQKDIKLFFE